MQPHHSIKKKGKRASVTMDVSCSSAQERQIRLQRRLDNVLKGISDSTDQKGTACSQVASFSSMQKYAFQVRKRSAWARPARLYIVVYGHGALKEKFVTFLQ